MNNLVYVAGSEEGYTRKKRGTAFDYFEANNEKIRDKAIIQRIKELVIPPMWQKVWICKNPNGHLQATGIDSKGRKQYLYHQEWSRLRNESKFHKMVEFGHALPKIRKTTEKDLRKHGWPREKVLALIVNILGECFLRIGNKTYTKQNETYGLTTLRNKHLDIKGSRTVFNYKAKGGKYRKISIEDQKLTRLIKACSQLPGYEVFQYVDANGTTHPVDSNDVNTYLQQITGESFTAKDFRTWGGTVSAVELFEQVKTEVDLNPRKNLTISLVKGVAGRLGNTVAVCREYYIHPCIISSVEKNSLDIEKLRSAALDKYRRLKNHLNEHELIALHLVEDHVNHIPHKDVVILNMIETLHK